MNVKLVSGDTCLDAWKAGCELVVDGYRGTMITVVERPIYFEDDWLVKYNPKHFYHPGSVLSDVINTIFPFKIWNKVGSREELYRHYLRVNARSSRIGAKKNARWGTYFGRMIDFGAGNINQIEDIINVLEAETRHFHVFNPIHISSADYDSLKNRLGNPCLQYVQFLQPEKGIIDIMVVYRNHDFFNKALGNYIGLGMLLGYVCQEAGKVPGKLICSSAAVYSDASKITLREIAKID